MQDSNPEVANFAAQNNNQPGNASAGFLSACATKNRRGVRAPRLAAALSLGAGIMLSACGPLLCSVASAQTRDGAAPTVQSEVSGQLPQIELRSSVQSAVDDLRQQGSNQLAVVPGKSALESAKPVGMFQGGTCIDPHPGSPSQSQQPIDQCHTQVWYKYTDGCTGYRIIATPGAGGNCGSQQQSMGENITWTFCATKHTK